MAESVLNHDFREVPSVRISTDNVFEITFEKNCTFSVVKMGKKVLIANDSEVTNQDRAPIGSVLKSINGEAVENLETAEINERLQTAKRPMTVTLELSEMVAKFQKESHKIFLSSFIKKVPSTYVSLESTRMTLLFFVLGGLDIIDEFEKREDKPAFLNWIDAQQIKPGRARNKKQYAGYRGGPFLGMKHDCDCDCSPFHMWDRDNLAQTASAFMIADIANRDLSKLDKEAILDTIGRHQQENGSFNAVLEKSEDDVRYICSAIMVCSLFEDFSQIDTEAAINYIISCQSYEGGFGFVEGGEAHGGGTFCSLASLSLLGALDRIRDRDLLIRWCIMRQGRGFSGRTNKPEDTCYSFWIGASLKILGVYNLTNRLENYKFVMSCQSGFGGFSKFPNTFPDIMHSYFGLAGLALMELRDDVHQFSTFEFPYRSKIRKKNI